VFIGSGWFLLSIDDFVVHSVRYNPLIGSSYIELPKFVLDKKACINVKNEDDEMCFKWAVLSVLYPDKNNANLVSSYTRYMKYVNWKGLKFPMTLSQIRKFERHNRNISVNVYTYKPPTPADEIAAIEAAGGIVHKHEFIPQYEEKKTKRNKHIDLLLITEGLKSHFVWIQNMSRLVARRTKHKRETFVCNHCSHPFTTEKAFDCHFPDCSIHARQMIKFPKDDDNELFWTARSKAYT